MCVVGALFVEEFILAPRAEGYKQAPLYIELIGGPGDGAVYEVTHDKGSNGFCRGIYMTEDMLKRLRKESKRPLYEKVIKLWKK
jgi:hypothetical protein